MNDEKLSIGEKIYELRKAKGISQEQFGDDLNVTRQTVSRWESNANIPEMEKINELARYFSVSTSYLLDVDITNFEKISNAEETKKIVNSCVLAVNEQIREQNKKSTAAQIKTVEFFAIAMVALFAFTLFFVVSNTNKFNILNSQFQLLQSRFISLENQIGYINRPIDVSKSELFSKADVQLGEYDFSKNTVELVANISLKDFNDSTKLKFTITFENEKITKEFALESGSLLNGIIELPINDKYEITATVANLTGNKNEELPVIYGAEENGKVIFISENFHSYARKSDCDKTGKYPLPPMPYHFQIAKRQLKNITLTAEDVKVSLYINDKFVKYGELFDFDDYDFSDSSPSRDRPTTPYPNSDSYVVDFSPTEMDWNDFVTIYVEVRDNTGREYNFLMGIYRLRESTQNNDDIEFYLDLDTMREP